MPLTLLLAIPDQPRFDADTSAEWTLLDGANAMLRKGRGALASVPRAERVIAIAPVNHLLFIETALPAVTPVKRNALLRYAIEDKLTIDPATVHAVVLGKSDTAQHVVAAIDRAWLSAALQWMNQSGIAPDSLVASAAGIAVKPGEWAVVLDRQHGFAKRADGFVFNFDAGGGSEPPFGLSLALKEARQHNIAPSALTVRSITSVPLASALPGEWEKALAIPVRLAAAASDDLQSLLAASKTSNLLTGEFAPRQAAEKWAVLLKPAAIALALIVVAHFAFTLIDNWRLDRQRIALEQEMTLLFKQAFPSAQAIVDPPLQMRRNLDQLKRERGMAGEDDAHAAIARATRLLQIANSTTPITSVSVREGMATLELQVTTDEQRSALRRAVAGTPGATFSVPDNAAPTTARITLGAGS